MSGFVDSVELMRECWSVRRRALVAAVAVAALLVTWRTLRPREYRSSTTLIVNAAGGAPSAAGALASQLGIGAAGTRGPTPPFVVELAMSSAVLEILGEMPVEGDGNRRLAEVLGVEERDPRVARFRGGERVRERVAARFSELTGNIGLSASMPSAELSSAVVSRWVDVVDSLDANARRRASLAEAQNYARQRATAADSLEVAEGVLVRTLTSNRSVSQSAELQQAVERLRSRVEFWRQLHSQAALAEQRALADGSREASQIAVLLEPEVPALPVRRRRATWGLIGLLVGGIGFTSAHLAVWAVRRQLSA